MATVNAWRDNRTRSSLEVTTAPPSESSSIRPRRLAQAHRRTHQLGRDPHPATEPRKGARVSFGGRWDLWDVIDRLIGFQQFDGEVDALGHGRFLRFLRLSIAAEWR